MCMSTPKAQTVQVPEVETFEPETYDDPNTSEVESNYTKTYVTPMSAPEPEESALSPRPAKEATDAEKNANSKTTAAQKKSGGKGESSSSALSIRKRAEASVPGAATSALSIPKT